jgi:non-specific serine/threonine protein kinase
MLGRSIAQYEIIEILGRGGMGVVYKALDTRLRRPVAIKMLPAELARDEASKKRLFAEARAASSLNHPNICTVYEIGEERDRLFLVMEYLTGHSLATEVARGPLEVRRAVQIAIQLAEALEMAHEHRVIHRDLKPSNVQVTEGGTAKILDFGLARIVEEVDPRSPTRSSVDARLTEPGTVAGTAAYMSPEQIRAEPLDARTDIFSFGVVLYEMLTGRPPFSGSSVFEVTASILRDEPPPMRQFSPGVPQALVEIVSRCLAKNCDNRYPDAAQLLTALQGQRSGTGTNPNIPPAIAVLYFENLSGETDDEYFRDGMTEDIITELCKIRVLRVFPRSAILEYRDKPVSASNIARDLAAAYVLTGSVRRSGDRLRITTQLVAGRSGQLIWGERYDRTMEDVFAIQDEIARTIASALSITLSPHEEQAIAQKPTENPQAYDRYLRARSFARRCTQPDLEYAVEMYEHAIALDAGFALAYAGLANACGIFLRLAWTGRGLDGERGVRSQAGTRSAPRASGSAGGTRAHSLVPAPRLRCVHPLRAAGHRTETRHRGRVLDTGPGVRDHESTGGSRRARGKCRRGYRRRLQHVHSVYLRAAASGKERGSRCASTTACCDPGAARDVGSRGRSRANIACRALRRARAARSNGRGDPQSRQSSPE